MATKILGTMIDQGSIFQCFDIGWAWRLVSMKNGAVKKSYHYDDVCIFVREPTRLKTTISQGKIICLPPETRIEKISNMTQLFRS